MFTSCNSDQAVVFWPCTKKVRPSRAVELQFRPAQSPTRCTQAKRRLNYFNKNQIMEPKPKSIQTIGILAMIFSCFIILGNSMGFLAATLLGFDSANIDDNTNLMSIMFNHYRQLSFMMVVIGLLYLVSGMYVRKYKLWANKLMTILSAIVILIIWGIMIAISMTVFKINEIKLFAFVPILVAIVFSIPVALLIRFLNERKTKYCFN